MKGSIVARGDSWRIAVSLGRDPQTGKYKQHFETVTGSKKDAQKRLRELLTELDRGTFCQPGKVSVAEYLRDWLRDTALPNMTPRTYEGYEYQVNKHIIPAIGQVRLAELKPQHLQALYSEKQTAGLHRTAQYIHNTLNKALATALKMGIIARNPATAVESPKVPRHEMQIMSESDIHLFLDFARNSPYFPLLYTALFTGLRRSELLALRWSDVDLTLCQLSVNRTIHVLRYGSYKGQVIFKQPKTAKSRRMIALSPSTAIVLREHKEAQAKTRRSLELPFTEDDLVFCQHDGKPYLPDSISHVWLKLARRTGLQGIHLHSARHSHASLMLKNGTHPKIVQERLGHSSIQVTLDIYSSVAPGMQEAAAARFDDILMPKTVTVK